MTSRAARSEKFGAAEGDGIIRCDACPVLCRIRPGRAGACSRYANDNGVLVRTASDKPPYFAIGFKSEKSNGKFRYIWLYKVRAKPVTENYATKEGGTITRQTGEVEWTCIKRTHDGRYQAVADEDENGFTAAKGATFLQTVYEPTFTVTP